LAKSAVNAQRSVQDCLPVGPVFAGFPAAVSDLQSEGPSALLRSADKIDVRAEATMEWNSPSLNRSRRLHSRSFHFCVGQLRGPRATLRPIFGSPATCWGGRR